MQFHPCFQFPGSPQEPWAGGGLGEKVTCMPSVG